MTMTSSQKGQAAGSDPLPSVHEHGVDGYTESAVGGFGEGYDSQVAHGGASDSPGAPSRSESLAHDAPTENSHNALEQAVLKVLARAHIDAAVLRVHAVGSEVRLSGTVRHLFEQAELEARARTVPGVSSVVSELTVLRADRSENE
jgi:hypothetical protein